MRARGAGKLSSSSPSPSASPPDSRAPDASSLSHLVKETKGHLSSFWGSVSTWLSSSNTTKTDDSGLLLPSFPSSLLGQQEGLKEVR